MDSAYRLEDGNRVEGFGIGPGTFEGATPPPSVFEVTPGNRVLWELEVVSGLDFVYRAPPIFTIGGEQVGTGG